MLAASGLEDPALIEMLNELETSRMDELMRLQVRQLYSHFIYCIIRTKYRPFSSPF